MATAGRGIRLAREGSRSKQGWPGCGGPGQYRGRPHAGQPAFEAVVLQRVFAEKAHSPPTTTHYLERNSPWQPLPKNSHACVRISIRRRPIGDQLFQDTREHVQNMAQGVKEQLAGFRQNMRDMHDGIAEMASQVRTELQDLSTDLHTGGDIFRKGSKVPQGIETQEAPAKSSRYAARLVDGATFQCSRPHGCTAIRTALGATVPTVARGRGDKTTQSRHASPDLQPSQQERKPPPHDSRHSNGASRQVIAPQVHAQPGPHPARSRRRLCHHSPSRGIDRAGLRLSRSRLSGQLFGSGRHRARPRLPCTWPRSPAGR